MKAIIGVFLISLLLDQLHATKNTTQICIKKTGINPYEEDITEERFFTYIVCRLTEMEIMKEDGSFNTEIIKRLFPKLEDQHRMEEIIKDCHLDKNPKIKSKMAENILRCTPFKDFMKG